LLISFIASWFFSCRDLILSSFFSSIALISVLSVSDNVSSFINLLMIAFHCFPFLSNPIPFQFFSVLENIFSTDSLFSSHTMLRSFSLRDVLLVSHFSCNAVFSVSVVAAFKFSKNCFSHSLSSAKRDSTVF